MLFQKNLNLISRKLAEIRRMFLEIKNGGGYVLGKND
jgi:hypothetical protein